MTLALFGVISIVFVLTVHYILGRMFGYKNLNEFYGAINDEVFFFFLICMSLLMAVVIMIFLCACNNTFWHIPY
mgnify:FL=1